MASDADVFGAISIFTITGVSMKTIILCASILMAGCASAPPPVKDETIKDSPSERRGSVRVVDHHCDGGQGVDALLLRVEGEGPVIIRWSNKGICGDPA